MAIATVTNIGIQDSLVAGTTGPKVDITYFKIGSSLITPNPNMTDLPDVVYTGDSQQIAYQVVDTNVVKFRITLDETVGDFNIGSFGLYTADDHLYCVATSTAVFPKIHTIPGTQIGNRRYLDVYIVMTAVSEILNLSIIQADEAALPTVATETLLPPADLSEYPVYLVSLHTQYGRPALACRYSGAWNYIPTDNGNSEGAYLGPDAFALNVLPGQVVYYSTITQKFEQADPSDPSKGYIGIRGNGNNLLVKGFIYTAPTNIYTTATYYYADVNPNYGQLTTVANPYLVGVAISPRKLLILSDKVNVPGDDKKSLAMMVSWFNL